MPSREGLRHLPAASLTLLFGSAFFSKFLVQSGAALGWLSLVARPRRLPAGLVAPLAVFFAASAVSALFSADPAFGLRRLAGELFAVGAAVAGAGIVTTSGAVVAATAFLVVGGLAGAASLYQYFVVFGGVLDYDHRAYGLMRPVDFCWHGDLMSMVFALGLGLVVWRVGRVRALAACAVVLAVVGMTLSYTRASWLASGLAVVGAGARRRSFALLAALGVLAGAILVLPGSDGRKHLSARVRSSFDASANDYRMVLYRAGMAVVRDYPVLGTGPGVLPRVFPRYALPPAEKAPHLHNLYLQFAAERGPVAVLAWLAAMVLGMIRALRAAGREGGDGRALAAGVGLVLGAALVFALFDYPWENVQLRTLILAFLGLAWSPALTGTGEPSRRA